MARIKYVGDLAVTSWRGVTFHQGLWTSPGTLGDDDIATLAANPTFVVDLPNDGPLDTPPSPPAPAPPSPVAASGVEPAPASAGVSGGDGCDGPDGTDDGQADHSPLAPPAASLSI